MTNSPTHSQAPVALDTTDGAVPDLSIGPQTLSEAIQELRATDSKHADQLIRAITEQFTSLKTSVESVIKAVNTSKEQPQSTDKKTAFWTAYKTLADEFDKEFQRKYRNDLDMILLFAGLFSAVSSAFIVQIQPELQPDPNVITQGLLGILVHHVTGSPPPPDLLPPPAAPVKIVIVAQGILYVCLFLTLLVALLAVLGKEWLLHYDSVGQFERGTIKERGLERQHKFDGMRRWKFELVLKIFPLLLQFSLVLFATALSIYLWTIHHAIASIVLGLTALGIILYAAMIISALVSQYSPFQTSLTLLLRTIFDGALCRLVQNSWKSVHSASVHLHLAISQCWSACTGAPLLPCFHNTDKPGPSESTLIFDRPPDPSDEVAAVIWAMETSTNPAMVHSAAEIVSEIQWPVNLDVRSSLKRLSDTFHTCFEESTVRDGMDGRAIACIKAFGVLEMVTDQSEFPTDSQWTFPRKKINTTSAELQSLVLMLRLKHPRSWPTNQPPHLTQWSLRFIPAQHLPLAEEHLETILHHFRPDDVPKNGASILADYLFCLNSIFIRTAAHDRSLLDKSQYLGVLTTQIFQNLMKHLTVNRPLHGRTLTEMLSHMSQIVDKDRTSYQQKIDEKCIKAAYQLCSLLPQEAIVYALHLVRVDTRTLQRLSPENKNVEWVYRILAEHQKLSSQSHAFVGDLLQVLVRSRGFLGKPSREVLCAILSALSAQYDTLTEPHDERKRVTRLASVVLCSADHWFQDDNLGPMLMKNSVWLILADQHLPEYTILGEKLSHQPELRKIISQHPPWWLNQYPWIMRSGIPIEQSEKFRSVLSSVWHKDHAEADQFRKKEKILVVVFMVLVNAWKSWDPVHFSDAPATLSLLECTVKISFSARVVVQHPSQRFLEQIMVRLGDVVAHAGERAMNTLSTGIDPKEGICGVAKFLSRLALTIKGELSSPETKFPSPHEMAKHWKVLQNTFYTDMVVLRKRMKDDR